MLNKSKSYRIINKLLHNCINLKLFNYSVDHPGLTYMQKTPFHCDALLLMCFISCLNYTVLVVKLAIDFSGGEIHTMIIENT